MRSSCVAEIIVCAINFLLMILIGKIISKNAYSTGIGTKAQQALKLQHEENKEKRKSFTKEKREEEEQRKFALRQQKRKEKHRGR